MADLEKKATTVGGTPTGDYTESGNPAHNPDGKFGEKTGTTGDAEKTASSVSTLKEDSKSKLKALLEKKRQLKLDAFSGWKEVYDKVKSGIQSLVGFDKARKENRIGSGDWNKKLTQQEYEIFDTALTKAFKENEIGSRIEFENLIKVIDSNKFINLHEAKRGGGCTSSEVRMNFSFSCFGSKYEPERINRYGLEKYGCVLSKDKGLAIQRSDGAVQYGDSAIVFKKDRMKGRTTYTIGDSLNNHHTIPNFVGNKFDANCFDYNSRFNAARGNIEKIKNAKNLDALKEALNTRYIECQFHGDVTLDDVDYFVVQDNKVKFQNPELIRVMQTVLSKRGIKVYTHDFLNNKDYEVKVGEDGKLYQEEVK